MCIKVRLFLAFFYIHYLIIRFFSHFSGQYSLFKVRLGKSQKKPINQVSIPKVYIISAFR